MYDSHGIEKAILEYWKKNKIFEKYLKSRKDCKKFYFLDGPPYASGKIHSGTALNKILKDFYIRFFKMKGYDIWLQPGYDTHGVPIENKVEKKLKIGSKKEIEKFGIEKFIKECRNFATEFIDVMSDQFLNLGVWMDWKHPYLTLDNSYMEGAWYTFKVAFEKGLLYKGIYPVHVCPHCETVVAYNEIEYQKLEEESVYVKFPVKGEENTYLLIWTTTPWTLPANTGIMVNPKYDYSKVRIGKEVLIIATERIKELMKKFNIDNYSILKTMKGRELVEMQYENPMKDLLPLQFNITGRVVLSEQFVSLDEGTGLVHTAPGHGKEDYKVGREFDLPMLSPLNLDGTFTNEAGFLYNKFSKSADPEIVAKLEERGTIFGKEKIKHDYPLCWRCDSPLLMMSVPQWFFKISEFRDKLIEENESVNWVPDWAQKRFKNWLESLDDWPISRQRYWGIPLPIWTCERCKEIKVLGSFDELPKKLKDVHRPYIDSVELKCKCGGVMKRIPDVLDVWFDSGVASWASLGYPGNKKMFKKLWPADLNIEGVDQVRGWWNSEIITSYITFGKKPFKNVVLHGFVLDNHGVKMSKSKGNVVTPEDIVKKYGRDILRYYFLSAFPGKDFNFDWKGVEDDMKFFTILYNSINFIETYCKKTDKMKNLKKEDEWIISKTNNLVKTVDGYNGEYNCYKSLEAIENFILNDLSHWYIKLIRNRVWTAYKGEDKEAANATCFYVLERLIKLLASFCPFLAEHFNLKFFKEKSIHLADWPEVEKKLMNKKLEEGMEIVKRIVELSNSKRHDEKIKLRYKLKKLTVNTKDMKLVKNLNGIIEKMANVESVEFKKADKLTVQLDTEATPELKEEWLLSELTRKIQASRKKLGFKVDDKVNLYLDESFKKHKERIEKTTGTKITFGKIEGSKFELLFDKKKYEFGIK